MTAPATVTMTAGDAAVFRKGHDTLVKRLSDAGLMALRIEEGRLMREQGRARLSGGPANAEEYRNSILGLRGYTIERLNQAIHVLHHEPGTVGSTACGWCVCQVTWTGGDGFLRQCTGAPGHGGRCRP